MLLYASTRSPFARKVLVVAHEHGLLPRIAVVPAVVGTSRVDAAVAAVNPLGQIPTLVLEDGRVLPDSLLICDYLDSIAPAPGLFPRAAPRRFEALARHALGQGMLETLVRLFGERRRAADPLHPAYDRALRDKFRRVVDALSRDCGDWTGRALDIGDITIACALAYADFRFDEEHWRDGHAALRDWYAVVAQRPSMLATAFVVPAG